MNQNVHRFGMIAVVAAAFLFLSSEARSQTAEKYLDASKAKIAEADKLQWGSDPWRSKLESALFDLSDAIKLDFENAAYYAKRAEVHEMLGIFKGAHDDADTAVLLAPNEPRYFVLRASMRYQLEAVRVADERRQMEPEEAAKVVADHKAALEDYSKAISLDPKNALWYGERGQFFESTKQPQRALADYTTAIDLDPRNLFIRWQRGMLRSQLGLYDEALADYTKIIESDPKRTAAYLARAEVYEALKSIADTTSAHKTAPNSPGPLQVRAERYRMIGKIALAKRDELAARRLLRSSKK